MHRLTNVPALPRALSFWSRLTAATFALIGSVVTLSSPTHAQKAGKWGEVGGWEIRVDPSVGNGCFASQIYEDGTLVRIGVDAEQKRIYLFFANKAWRSLEEGKIYRVRIVFDGASGYNGDMVGYRLSSGSIVLAHRDLSSAFVKDFMQRNGMRIHYQGNQLSHLSLRNTYAAVGEVYNCQKEFGFGSGSSRDSDPFSSSGGGKSDRDPFR